MGFDELNIISNPDTDSGGGSGGASGGGAGLNIDPLQYDFLKNLDTSKLDEIKEKLRDALKVAIAIGIVIAAWKVANGVVRVFNTFSALGGIAKTVGTAVKGSGLVAFFSKLSFAIQAVAGGAATFGEAIVYVFQGTAGILSGVVLAITGAVAYFKNLFDLFKNGESVTNILGAAIGGLIASVGAFLIAIGVGATVATGGIAALVVGAVAAVGIIAGVIYNHWDEIKVALGKAWKWFDTTIIQPIKETLSGIAEWFNVNVIQPVIAFFQPIKDAFQELKTYAITRFTEIKDGIVSRVTTVWNKIVEIKNKIVEIVSALWKYVKTTYIDPFINKITTFYNEKIKPIIDAVKLAFSILWNAFKTAVVDKIKSKLDELKAKLTAIRDFAVAIFKGVGKFVVDFVSGLFKSVVNAMFTGIENKINRFIRMLNSAIYLINKIPGVSISRVEEITGRIPQRNTRII